jgi:hypothetical protein
MLARAMPGGRFQRKPPRGRHCTVRENREVRTMATTWAERLEAKGREEGLQEGFKAMRDLLLRQLEQRFGPLPNDFREQVETISSLKHLTQLGQRVLTARSLESLRLLRIFPSIACKINRPSYVSPQRADLLGSLEGGICPDMIRSSKSCFRASSPISCGSWRRSWQAA